MHGRGRILGVWACFVARLLFCAAALPLWEGYDEWAHFSVIRIMAERGVLLVPRDAPVPKDVAASLNLSPVAWELRAYPAPALTQDAFWKLSAEERVAREAALRDMPPAWRREPGPAWITAYEALQPPLYYWMMAPVVHWLDHRSLGTQVMVVRWLSALLASLAIPLIYGVAKALFESEDVGLACAAIAALMPGWMLDVARVGNDCLSVVLFSLAIWLGLKLIEEGPRIRWTAGLGAALGCGLLTKAWFLTALPVVLLLYLWLWRKRRPAIAGKEVLADCGVTMGLAAAISGWWFLHNVFTNGTLTGLSESVMLRDAGLGRMVAGIWQVSWTKAVDSILFSHLYFGGWSSLVVRAWMYHVFYALVAVAAVGLVRVWWLSRAKVPRGLKPIPLDWVLSIYAAFWAGQLYNVLLISLSKGVPTSMGWYLYAVIAAEVPLCVAGLRGLLPEKYGNWPLAGGVLLFGLFDLYTMHAVALPYYTGLIGHQASGALGSLHWADLKGMGWGVVLHRLTVFKGGLATRHLWAALWIGSLLATAWLVLEGVGFAAPGRRRDILR